MYGNVVIGVLPFYKNPYRGYQPMNQEVMSLKLSDFGLAQERGFLPAHDPLTTLTYAPPFSPLEELANNLPKLLAAGTFRTELDETSRFLSEFTHMREIVDMYVRDQPYLYAQRLKLICDYLGQSYIWGEDPPINVIPAGFSHVWCDISDRLELPPILSYAPYALYNWRRLDPNGPIALGNLAILQNFLGGLDEDWFILIHVDIERRAGEIPATIIDAMQAIAAKDTLAIETCLLVLTVSLNSMLETLDRIPEYCDPYIYYTRVRPYLHGSKNNEALPNGIIYEGRYENEPQYFRGESGAQSAIVPSMVTALDIRHSENEFTAYLKEMPAYMPVCQRRFIATIQHLSRNGFSMLDFVLARKQSHPALYDTYRSCRRALHAFRKKHYEYVGRYIHAQAQRHTGNPTAVGTAGTPFMVALKQLLDETWFD